MTDWFISDTHLNHRRVAEYCGRPANHEDLMWKGLSMVQGEDTLVHVGDVVFARNAEAQGWLERLPGAKKILVEGNHDKRNRKIRKWKGWDLVTRYKQVWRFKQDGIRVAVSHRPQEFEGLWHTADVIIHGHTHEKGQLWTWKRKTKKVPIFSSEVPPFQCLVVNCCVEQTRYVPISWDQIKEEYERLRAAM